MADQLPLLASSIDPPAFAIKAVTRERRIRQTQLQSPVVQSDKAMHELQEQDRRRIARDLHDGLGHLLTLISLEASQFDTLVRMGRPATAMLVESITRVKSRIEQAFDELRRAVMDLRPPMLDDLGIVPTVSWFCREVQASHCAVIVQNRMEIAEELVPPALRIVIFRVIQEAVSNTLKHAHASRVIIDCREINQRIQLSISDDGCGFDLEAVLNSSKRGGVVSISQRVADSNGICTMQSIPGGGSCITASWQLTN